VAFLFSNTHVSQKCRAIFLMAIFFQLI
jgi:hypothetical protein